MNASFRQSTQSREALKPRVVNQPLYQNLPFQPTPEDRLCQLEVDSCATSSLSLSVSVYMLVCLCVCVCVCARVCLFLLQAKMPWGKLRPPRSGKERATAMRQIREWQRVKSEKVQNEKSPNFSNFRPEFCSEKCSKLSPKFSRIFRALFAGKWRPQKIHLKSPPFFNAKSPGKLQEKIHKLFWRAGNVTTCTWRVELQPSFTCPARDESSLCHQTLLVPLHERREQLTKVAESATMFCKIPVKR